MDPEIDPATLEARALDLYRFRLCPHCGKKISRWEALSMVIGSAIHYFVKVRHIPTGEESMRDILQINPQTMLIIHPDD